MRLKICTVSTIVLMLLAVNMQAQYYNSAGGISGGNTLKLALHNIIKNHNGVGYSGLWNAFASTDSKVNGKVWDIYSYKFVGAQPYEYTHFNNQCGQYTAEGQCYNREHTWPQSFFNSAEPMQSDLFHVYPTDGFVNGKRNNFAYGKVQNTTYTSQNGSKLGTGNTYVSGGTVFEPIDSFKGDIARNYFYMNTRYTGLGSSWGNWEMATGPELTTKAIALLLDWHHADPVSKKEIDRNNAVYFLQGNRNPFIDYPIYADCIWGNANCGAVGITEWLQAIEIDIYPNPATSSLQINIPLTAKHSFIKAFIIDAVGRQVQEIFSCNEPVGIENLPAGSYYIKIVLQENTLVKHFIKN